MINRLYLIVFAFAVLLCGCNSSQDAQISQLQDQVKQLQAQLAADEQKLAFASTNFNSMQYSQIASFVETLEKVDQSEAAGQITHEKAQQLRDVLTGKIPLYVGSDGQITTNSTATVIMPVTKPQ